MCRRTQSSPASSRFSRLAACRLQQSRGRKFPTRRYPPYSRFNVTVPRACCSPHARFRAWFGNRPDMSKSSDGTRALFCRSCRVRRILSPHPLSFRAYRSSARRFCGDRGSLRVRRALASIFLGWHATQIALGLDGAKTHHSAHQVSSKAN